MKKDKIFIAVYLVFCIGLSLFIYFPSPTAENARADIYRSGEKVSSLPLDEDGEYTFEDIGYTIASEDGKVFVKETYCPGKLCMHMGKISKAGASLLCVPNEITVMIVSGEKDGLDGIAG